MMFWWIIIVCLVVFSGIAISKQGSFSKDRVESPLEIAKKRYASGEISKEEFDQIRKDIG